MKVTALLSSALLLAGSAVAAPRGPAPANAMGHGLAARVAARAENKALSRSTKPLIKVGSSDEVSESKLDASNPNATRTHVEYSSNWAGAVIESPPAGTFTAVAGTFTVPTPSVPSGASGSGTYAASAWVGIDGDTYTNAILQTGIDFEVTSSGSVSFDAWYEWYPDYAYEFSGFSVSAGDVIALSVESSSSTAGTVVIENQTTGKSVSKTLSAPESSASLGGQNAEWIVEDFEENGSLVSFADFGTVVFSDATAETSDGTSVGPSSATEIDIRQSGKVLTDVTISSTEVTVTYE